MCDTLGLILPDRALFAKNSDRSPNEPQVCEFHPRREHTQASLQVTYLTIDQVNQTHACLLSRPTWLWGAEMGVNEYGVCIGNEAVFTRGAYAKSGLTGMDLVRLGLERGASAVEARDVILALLERYGQGGNCGYDHEFFYDNSFLIMDRQELFVLETAGKQWAWKSYPRASISNRLTLRTDADACSANRRVDFQRAHANPLITFFSGSKSRWRQTCEALTHTESVPSLFSALRRHEKADARPLCQPSVRSTCMHAGGLVGDHTTASIVVELDQTIKVWLTGSSTPCISLFKPWLFSGQTNQLIIAPDASQPDGYWQERERFHRALIGRQLPQEYYHERDQLEAAWFAESRQLSDWAALTEKALLEESAFTQRWETRLSGTTCGSRRFLRYWEKKNQRLGQPRA